MRLRATLQTLALVPPLAVAALIPERAEACSPLPCESFSGWTSLEPINAAAIPTDGVLLLQGARIGDLPDEAILSDIALTVTRDGLAVSGTLEVSPVNEVLIWRPDQPLAPGATYQVSGTILIFEEVDFNECSSSWYALDFAFLADAAPTLPLQVPDVAVMAEVQTQTEEALDSLVCCDGAMPEEETLTNSCGGESTEVYWTKGQCLPNVGLGSLIVELTVTTGLPPATAAIVAQQLIVDGQPGAARLQGSFVASREQPFCTEIALLNLATGETLMSPKACHGEAVAGQLGPQNLDPGPELASLCSGEPYTCAIVGGFLENMRWDPAQCVPWPGVDPTTGGTTDSPTTGDTTDALTTGGAESTSGGAQDDNLKESGCGCDTRPPAPPALLMLLMLVLLGRRRRPVSLPRPRDPR